MKARDFLLFNQVEVTALTLKTLGESYHHKGLRFKRTKHIKVDCHSIREAYDDHTITLLHVYTSSNCRYLHKALTWNRHQL